MRQQRHVREHFLIDEFIRLGDLDAAIQHHHTPVRQAFEDDDVLEGAAGSGKFARYLEALLPRGIEGFG